MADKWANFQKKVEAEIQPILFRAGYTLSKAVAGDDSDVYESAVGFVMWYDNEGMPRIQIDTLERTGFEAGTIKNFNWLRVHIGAKRLKELMGTASETNMYLYDGWIWETDEQLDHCIAEIAQGFNAYFNNQLE